jgi:hypothetical protein
MAGLWERISNVWSNEMLTGAEAGRLVDNANAVGKTDAAQKLLAAVDAPGVNVTLRDAALSMGVPVEAVTFENLVAESEQPRIIYESDWLYGYDSDFKYAIGRSREGFHVGTFIADAPASEYPRWDKAVRTREEAEMMAERAMAEWSRNDVAIQQAEDAEEAEQLPETAAGPRIVYTSEWHQGFGSEFKYHIGESPDGWHYATQTSENSESDLMWSAAFPGREKAENLALSAYSEWDNRIAEAEQAYEDREIARIARSRGMSVEV